MILEALKVTYQYILIGIQTGLALITNTPTPEHTLPPVPFSQEYKSPLKTLGFFYTLPTSKPIEVVVTATTSTSTKATKPVATSTKTTTTTKPTTPPPAVKQPAVVPPTTPKQDETPVETKVVIQEDAVVNIICVETLGNLTRSTTGSGVIITSDGVIVTNAHVAIDLMKPGYVCTVRTGSLAKKAYVAEVLYIPDQWVQDNEDYISAGIVQATTGEHDFALLQITGSATGSKLPTSFTYITPDTGEVSKGDDIETIGYPAERVGLFSAASKLYRIANETTVKSVYSFGETTTDLISTGKVSNAEQGSSGGAIVRNGKLVGIIANVNGGTINGLSMGYIKRYFERDADVSFVK